MISTAGLIVLIIFAVIAAFILGWLVGSVLYGHRRYRPLYAPAPLPAYTPMYDIPTPTSAPAATMPVPATPAPTVDTADLKIVEGIGPKIEEVLKNGGIENWTMLASASLGTLQALLSGAGPRFAMHDPSSWAEQASLARDGKWDELHEYQDFLVGGR